jgi:hypothetical protein
MLFRFIMLKTRKISGMYARVCMLVELYFPGTVRSDHRYFCHDMIPVIISVLCCYLIQSCTKTFANITLYIYSLHTLDTDFIYFVYCLTYVSYVYIVYCCKTYYYWYTMFGFWLRTPLVSSHFLKWNLCFTLQKITKERNQQKRKTTSHHKSLNTKEITTFCISNCKHDRTLLLDHKLNPWVW